MIWDRTEYAVRTAAKGAKVYWGSLFRRYGETHYSLLVSLMEFAYALLFDPIEDDLQKDTKTVQNCISNLKDFLEFLKTEHYYSVQDFDQAQIRDYLGWLLKERQLRQSRVNSQDADLAWVAARISAIQMYFRYGKRVSHPLSVNPLHGESVFVYLGKRPKDRRENTTPVIPKVVWDAYLGAALDYVEIYAPDILHGQKFIETIRSDVSPKFNDRPGFNVANFTKRHVDASLAKMRHNFVNNPATQKPWRTNWSKFSILQSEIRALYDACLVIIGCLSGMRESELSLLEVGAYWTYTALEGPAKRYRVASRLTKGTQDSKKEWEVNEPVFKACKIVEALTSYARLHVNHNELFLQSWDITPGYTFRSEIRITRTGSLYGKRSIMPVGPQAFTRYLRRFADHLENAFDGQYHLPPVNASPWIFIMRMLRRSLAGRIAREPFGMIAGMLHYKHVKITTFAGYAGSDNEWLEELREQEVAANDEFLADIWDDLQEGALAGAKGEEIMQEFLGMAGDLKQNAHQYFLESTRANLHIGFFNYCIFQKDRALCLKETESEGDFPIVNACHPDRCANSCVTRTHLPQWQTQKDDAQAMLAHKKVSEPQRIALSRDLEKIVRIVDRLRS